MGALRAQDDGHIPEETDAQILETLNKIRKRDASIYDASAKFYAGSVSGDGGGGEDAGEAAAPKSKKPKKMFLKDVIYKQVQDTFVKLWSASWCTPFACAPIPHDQANALAPVRCCISLGTDETPWNGTISLDT